MTQDQQQSASRGSSTASGRPQPSIPNPAAADGDEYQGASRRAAVAGLIVVLVLVALGYFLVVALRDEGNREDCMMSGRTNCAPLDIPNHK